MDILSLLLTLGGSSLNDKINAGFDRLAANGTNSFTRGVGRVGAWIGNLGNRLDSVENNINDYLTSLVTRDPYNSGRSQWREGNRLEDWQRAPTPDQPEWIPEDASQRLQEQLRGLGGSPTPQRTASRTAAGAGSHTLATGAAARGMVEGWQQAERQQIMDAVARQFRQRAQTIEQ